ncbi:hypothetical protein GE253_22040 [Niveispirillum sp. SYP-B3756]|nr:hypothetical protein [Niveispirillum sp. SYP-B3756]
MAWVKPSTQKGRENNQGVQEFLNEPSLAFDSWTQSMGQLLDGPSSVFWWPGLLIAGLAALFFWPHGRVPGTWLDYLRQLPLDAGCFLANSTLPFLLAPFFFWLSVKGSHLGIALTAGIHGGWDTVPGWPALAGCAAFAFVAGDFALYWTHRAFHHFPPLWRAHRLHHAPPVLTPLTAFRFWPWEQALHMSANILAQGVGLGLAVGVFGGAVTPLTVLGVNIFSLAWGLGFAHLRHSPVPLRYPRWLSFLLVSPHMHQLHHSDAEEHRDRNFATVFALWDWIFGTLTLTEQGQRFRFGLMRE